MAGSLAPEMPDAGPAGDREADPRRPLNQLSRKGIETRRRLLDAARTLLATTSPVTLTATAVARLAGISSASLYVYFDDVGDLVHALAGEASEDLDEVMAALDRWCAGLPALEGAKGFSDAFRAHWERYRPILSLRNMEADRGDVRYLKMRRDVGRRIIGVLADLIHRGHADQADFTHGDALGRATVIYSAIERLGAAARIYPEDLVDNSRMDAIHTAQIAILAELTLPRAAP